MVSSSTSPGETPWHWYHYFNFDFWNSPTKPGLLQTHRQVDVRLLELAGKLIIRQPSTQTLKKIIRTVQNPKVKVFVASIDVTTDNKAIKQFKNSVGRVAGGLILKEHQKTTEMTLAEILHMDAESQ